MGGRVVCTLTIEYALLSVMERLDDTLLSDTSPAGQPISGAELPEMAL